MKHFTSTGRITVKETYEGNWMKSWDTKFVKRVQREKTIVVYTYQENTYNTNPQ